MAWLTNFETLSPASSSLSTTTRIQWLSALPRLVCDNARFHQNESVKNESIDHLLCILLIVETSDTSAHSGLACLIYTV